MKRLAVILVSMVLLMTGLIGLAQLPGEVNGVNDYQTSATVGPGHNTSETTWISSGAILTWSYTTMDNFEFWAFSPTGVLDHQYPGTEGSTYINGALVNISGNYTFAWKSHELSSSATVDWTVRYFIPSGATLTSPRSGLINNELNLTVSGTMDTNASHVDYSLNNVTFNPVTLGSVPGTWSANLNLLNGNNTLYLATTYDAGNFTSTNYQAFPITSGFGLNFIPILRITSPIGNISTLNPTLYGTCDVNASAVYVSLDNVTFENATKDSSTWQSHLTLNSGSNIIFMKEDYQRGNFSYQYYSHVSIIADVSGQNQNIGNYLNGIGLILIGLVIVLVVAYVIIKRSK